MKDVSKKEQRKIEQIQRFAGKDLCACGRFRLCQGICRETHTNSSGVTVCGELYQIDMSALRKQNRKPRRTWRFGKQKDAQKNLDSKHRRREKFERDMAEGV